MSGPQPEQLPLLWREAVLVPLVAAEKIDLGQATRARVGDDGGEQHRCGIAPPVIGQPCALVEAHASRHLEGHEDRDNGLAHNELMEGDLVDFSCETTGGREPLEAGEKVGTVPPVGAMELSKGSQGSDRRRATLYADRRAFGRQTGRSPAEIPAETCRAGGPVVLEIGRERYPRGDRERFTADVSGQDCDQPRVGSDALQIKQA
jgi:hypothetical protein